MSKTLAATGPENFPLSRDSIIRDCAKLASSAERWGSAGQGEKLAKIARCLSNGDLTGAMKLRDEIKKNLDRAKSDRLFVVVAILAPLALGVAIYLVGRYG